MAKESRRHQPCSFATNGAIIVQIAGGRCWLANKIQERPTKMVSPPLCTLPALREPPTRLPPTHSSRPSTSPSTTHNQTPPFPTSCSPRYAPGTSTAQTPPSPPAGAHWPGWPSSRGSRPRRPSTGRARRRGTGTAASWTAGSAGRWAGSWPSWSGGASRSSGRVLRRRGGSPAEAWRRAAAPETAQPSHGIWSGQPRRRRRCRCGNCRNPGRTGKEGGETCSQHTILLNPFFFLLAPPFFRVKATQPSLSLTLSLFSWPGDGRLPWDGETGGILETHGFPSLPKTTPLGSFLAASDDEDEDKDEDADPDGVGV